MISSTVRPNIPAFVAVVTLVECALNLDVSTPALCRDDFIHLAIVLDVTGPCLIINDQNTHLSLRSQRNNDPFSLQAVKVSNGHRHLSISHIRKKLTS